VAHHPRVREHHWIRLVRALFCPFCDLVGEIFLLVMVFPV